MDEITQLVILIFVGIAGGFIAKRFKLPVIVGYIIGSAIYSSFFHPVTSDGSMISELAEIGVTLLLFSIGIDISLDKLFAVKKYAVIGGIAQIVLTIISSVIIFPLFNFTWYQSLFLGAVFSLSSTAVVVRILEELDIMDSLSSEISLGWLILQDIAVVFLIILLGSLANTGSGGGDILLSLLKSFILIATSLVIGRKLLPKILNTISDLGSKELVIISAFGFSLLYALLAEKLGVSSTLGAFLAGIMISDSVLNHEIITEIKPLQAIFSMLFFVTIGSLFSLNYVIGNFGIIMLILLIIISLKIAIVLGLNLLLKLHFRTALEISFYLAQVGEFAFLSAQIGLHKGWIPSNVNDIVIAVTVLSLVITPILILNVERVYIFLGDFTRKNFFGLYRKLFSNAQLELELQNKELKNHIIIFGFGRVGKYLALALRKMRYRYLVVELNNISDIVAEVGEDHVIVGDATSPEILRTAGIESAKIAIITLPKSADSGEVIRLAKSFNPDIQLIIRKHHDSLIFNKEDVFAVIEPEFEATIKMLEKLLLILRKKDKKIIDWVRVQKKTLH